MLEGAKQCVFKGVWVRELSRVGWARLTFALWSDGRATQIVEIEDEPMLAPSIWDLVILEMVEKDGCKWVGVGNKGGRLERGEEKTFVASPFSWNITFHLRNTLFDFVDRKACMSYILKLLHIQWKMIL